MRIKLSMLFIAIGLFALVFGILFMTPVFIAGAFCSFTMMLTPAIWLTGAIYSRGIWRPFFIGGIFTGFVPHVCTVYYGIMIVFASGSEVFEKGLSLGVTADELLTYRLTIAGIWFTPGVFAFTGGAVSMLTYRIVHGREQPTAPQVSLNQKLDS